MSQASGGEPRRGSLRAARALRIAALLALVALAIAGAANHELWTYDEPREAELARAMWRSGNYVYTVLGERPFLEKPPLFSATVALAFRIAGQASAPLARLVAAAWAAVSLGAVWWLARRAIGERAGVVAALVLATSGRFFTVAHTLLLDNALVAATTVALVTGWVAARERRRRLAAVAWAALAAAFLTKGLVGCGIVGVVLGFDLALRRDKAGALTLLNPLTIACFVVPVLGYVGLLFHAGGERGPEFVTEMFWKNQFGRFFSGYATRNEHWYVYWKSWPEMLAPWTPLAAIALVVPFVRPRTAAALPRSAGEGDGSRDLERFLAIWAVVPLVLLTLSKGKARNYALPVVPAHALLIASWWHSSVLDRELPAWGKRLFRALSQILPVAVLVGVGAILAHDVTHIEWMKDYHPPEHDPLWFDGTLAGAALISFGIAGFVFRARRAGRLASTESGALVLGLVVIAGFLGYSSTYFARRGDLSRSYEGLARDVWKQAGSRRLLLFHANDSWSGTFAFLAGRSTPEFNELWDPRGERFLDALGPAEKDVALAARAALQTIAPERRSALAIEWSGSRAEDRGDPSRQFVLVHRRRPDEPPRDPLAPGRRAP